MATGIALTRPAATFSYLEVGDDGTLTLKNPSGTTLFSVASDGTVTAAAGFVYSGADDFGSTGIKADVIAESTGAAGVTVDGLLLKDGFVVALDNQGIKIGTGVDDTISHNGTLTTWTHITGNLVIDNTLVTGATYFDLGTDTSATSWGVRNNSGSVLLGITGAGLATLAGSLVVNDSGALKFGSPGTDVVFTADGTDVVVTATGDLVFADAVDLKIGTGKDLGLRHDGSHSYVESATGNLIIDNQAATGTTAMDLGTDTTATKFAVRNNSLAQVFAVDGAGNVMADIFVTATIAVANATGGSTDALASIQLKRLDGTNIASVRDIMVVYYGTQYAPSAASVATVTHGTFTAGSSVAAGSSWAILRTDATGLVGWTVSDSADETLYFSVRDVPSGSTDITKGCMVVSSNSDSAAWSA